MLVFLVSVDTFWSDTVYLWRLSNTWTYFFGLGKVPLIYVGAIFANYLWFGILKRGLIYFRSHNEGLGWYILILIVFTESLILMTMELCQQSTVQWGSTPNPLKCVIHYENSFHLSNKSYLHWNVWLLKS